MSKARTPLPLGEPVEDWSPRPWPPRSPMHGRYASLVPFDLEAHVPALFEAYAEDHSGRIWTYLPQGPFADEAGFRAWAEATCLSDDPLMYTIIDRSSVRPLGMAALMRIVPAHGVIEIGHINIAPAMQRTRASTEAIYLMLKRCFDELGYRRVEWKCHAEHAVSRRAAQRYGFTFEGVFRQHMVIKSRNRDTAWFAMLDDDWPRIRAAFDAWLDPGNFDNDGGQRRSLAALISA